ncbi:hypothetical protein CRUP_005511 [Coryphaenoides rupestris]|nr:hypothetical protein CRUP_005511 [Coryphaenoides rupestris]
MAARATPRAQGHAQPCPPLCAKASIALDVGGKAPTGTLTVSVSPGHGLPPNVTVTLELLYVESEGSRAGHSPGSLRSSLTPTKKVDVDRTIMPDGTIVTTLTDPSCRGSGKTPTKRSTLIISGVSKAPLAEDDHALSTGYAVAMDAAMHTTNHPHQQGAVQRQDPDERTPSDVSERPSVDDVESDTGSNGALETRSLKDHKVGFLRSGSKLLFRRRRRKNKDPAISQSHEDLSQLSPAPSSASGPAPSASGPATGTSTLTRKSSGSFSRRLIKRFSFRSSSGKSKTAASPAAANGGGGGN